MWEWHVTPLSVICMLITTGNLLRHVPDRILFKNKWPESSYATLLPTVNMWQSDFNNEWVVISEMAM